MNNYIRICLFFSFLALSSSHVIGQKYNSSGGIRFGDDVGIAFAQRVSERVTFNLLVEPGILQDHQYFTLFANNHKPLISNRFNFFVGGGVFVSSAISTNYETSYNKYGPMGSFGGELTIGRIILSADWIPRFNVASNGKRFESSSSIALKYVIYKRPTKVASWRDKLKAKFKTKRNQKK